MTVFRRGLAYALLGSVAMPTGAYAQQTSQGLQLEEIVVTARKRDESLFEIPVSVSAFSQSQLERAGVDNAEELSAFVPGLDFQGATATGGRVNPTIRFRGINQQIITPSNQIGALFWDGSYIGGGGGFLPLGDVERVEVIKGPQTAYFGRNTFSGAVNIIPKLPGDEWEGDLAVEWSPSQTDEYKVEAGIGGPITETVGLRIWAGYEKDGGDFKTQREQEGYAVNRDKSVSGTLTVDASEDLSLKFTGYYTKADDNGTSMGKDARIFGVPGGQCNIVYTGEYLNPATGQRTPFTRNISDFTGASWCGKFPNGEGLVAPFTVRPGPGDSFLGDGRLVALQSLHPLMEKYGIVRQPDGKLGGNNQTYRLQFSGDYDFADHTLAFQVSRSNTGTNDVRDFNFGVGATPQVFILGNEIALRETYYEARIASPQDQRLRYLIGFSDYTQRYRLANSPVSVAQVATGAGATVDFQDNTTTGVFGSIDYDITDELTLSAEMRYTEEESIVLIQGNPAGACGGFSPVCDLKNDYKDFIPRVILNYDVFDGASTYASYSESSLLGVPTQAGFVNSVAPEIIPADQLAALGEFTPVNRNTQYEIGWKQQADTWNFTLALFHARWNNQPFASVILLPTGGTTSFASPGDSKFTGFDLEYNIAPTDWLTISGTVAYARAKLITFASRGSNEFIVLGSGPLSVVNDGNDSRNSPFWTGSLSPTIVGEFGDREWFIRADFLYDSPYWADYSEYNRVGDKFIVNARAGIDLVDGARLEVYGKNLTHNKTLQATGGTTSGPANSRKVFTEPYQKPEFGMRLTYQF